MYGWSGICARFRLSSFMFSLVTSSSIVLLFSYISISPFLLSRSLLGSCAYASIESFDYIIWSLFELKAIFLTDSVKALCLSRLNACCVFTFNLYFLWILYGLC